MTLQQYYNRFNASQGYDELLFRAAKGLQSAELNEIQSGQLHRLKKITDSLFKDGAVIRDGAAVIDPDTGVTQMQAGAIYVIGAIRDVAAATFTIPVSGTVQIGVRVVTAEITELEDPGLRDPATGTRNYQEAGAGRLRRLASWGWSGDGQPGDFYSVYTVRDGVLVTVAPPSLDPVLQLVARYDRESNGNYLVRGLNVVPLGLSSGQQVFSVGDGVANVQGFKVDKISSTRLRYTEDPDLEQINNEPKTSTTTSAQTFTLNYKPVESILDVVITAQKTVTINRGPFTGGTDQLPDTSVLSVVTVSQGATTYTAGTDFNLVGDSISWSPAGSEPAPGSSYSVTYRYLTSVTPTNVNLVTGTFQVTGAVSGTLVLVDYRWKLPRTDVIAVNQGGDLLRIKGQPSRFGSPRPPVPSTLLALATVSNAWGAVPTVTNDAVRVTDMTELGRVREAIGELYGLIAQERLKTDISSRQPTSKSGVFVDPFLDNDLRDLGIEQDAVIVDGDLQLAVAPTVVDASQNNTQFWMLPYTDEVLVEQTLRTGEMKINPYMAFDPVPARVALQPALDLWTVTTTDTVQTTSQQVVNKTVWLRRFIRPWQRVTTTTSTQTLISQTQTESELEFLRQRTVSFTVEGFGSGEVLAELRFDGIDITPA